nr:E3 ubiquitin-protein ligase UPL1-like [Tanacetum cinerariifolium]
MVPSCNPGFITTIVTLVTHIYCGVGDAKKSRNGGSGSGNQRFMPPLNEATITTIVEMGFTRARAEEALRRVETNSVEMAMEWLFTHAEDPVQEDDELAKALALSLGNSSETPKVDNLEKPTEVQTKVAEAKTPPIDDILSATMKLFQSNESMAFPLTDLLETSTLCMISHILALLLAEDVPVREMAVKNDVVSISIDILMKFLAGTESQEEVLVPKCVSALLLILDNLLQSRPKLSPDSKEGSQAGLLPNSKEEQASLLVPLDGTKEKPTLVDTDKEKGIFETIFGKSTGYLTIEEGGRVLAVACDLIKRHVPAIVIQAPRKYVFRRPLLYGVRPRHYKSGHGSTSFTGRKSNAIFALPGHGSTSSVDRRSNAIFALPGHGSTSSVNRKSNVIFALPGHRSTSSAGRKPNAIFALPDHGSTSSVDLCYTRSTDRLLFTPF